MYFAYTSWEVVELSFSLRKKTQVTYAILLATQNTCKVRLLDSSKLGTRHLGISISFNLDVSFRPPFLNSVGKFSIR